MKTMYNRNKDSYYLYSSSYTHNNITLLLYVFLLEKKINPNKACWAHKN